MVNNYPVTPLWITRFLVALVVILALMAGFFQAQLQAEKAKYQQLELEYQRAIGENNQN